MTLMKTLVTCVMGFAALSMAEAKEQVGTLTQVEGDVKLFFAPSKSPDGEKPRALFEGEYFTVRAAKQGDTVENGNIVRTHPGSKARVVFPNGDQYNVAASSAYRVQWKDDAGKDPQVQLMYGKIRGIVAKGGPRSKLMIRTKNAVMGVRGTDFYIADDGADTTEVSVMRGQVAVAPVAKAEDKKATPPKEIQVQPGQSAEVTQSAAEKAMPAAVVRKTSKEEFKQIVADSTFSKPASELSEPLKRLEEKAKDAVIQDIKKENPKLAEQMLGKGPVDVAAINSAVVQDLEKNAPATPKRQKPKRKDLDAENAYKRYFKDVE